MSDKNKSSFMVVMFALIAKSAKLLKFVKLFKVAKPMVLLVTMSISAVAYAFMLGPWLAVLFVFLLLVHEMGHVAAMKIKGFDTPTPVFIPFLGAAIFAPKFGDRDTEAYVGYGGPLLGTIATIAVFGLWFAVPKETDLAHILLVGAYLSAFLNLFNLIPVSPLDGGRVTQAAGRWFKYIGLIALAVFSVIFRQPVILYIWILVLFDLTMIPVRLRAVIVTLCWVSMAVLMWMGYGDQPVWVNVLDCAITLIFVIISIRRALGHDEDTGPDERPELNKKQRYTWMASYLGLGAVLVLLLMVLTRYLPTVAP